MLHSKLLHRMVRWAAARSPGGPHQTRLGIRIGILLAAFAGVVAFQGTFTSADERRPRTYTVLVGAVDDSEGANVMAFFPGTLRIHVGDTVHWQRNGNEIHTVTFLAGMPLPPFNVPAPDGLPSPQMRNPLIAFPVRPADGRYDGTTFATSGIFGPDPDLFQGIESFDLTF